MSEDGKRGHSDHASKSKDSAMMPLAMAVAGQELILVRVTGGRKIQHRLAEMGLGPGVHFTVHSRGQPGPFIISLKDSRLVLGRGIVQSVFVREP